MRKILGLFAICLSFGAFAGNNDIYITQTGTGLTMNIDQIGATNKVGTSSSRATFSGTSMIFSQNSAFPDDPPGDPTHVKESAMNGNNIYLKFKNTTELSCCPRR